MEGKDKKPPVFHSDDIKSSMANSDKEYFVNVIKDPFQQWLLRKKPSKVRVEQEFETAPTPPTKPEEKPKASQCRVAIRLTTEKLRRDSQRFKTPFILLCFFSVALLATASILAYMNFFGEKKTETKTVYVDKNEPCECEEKNKGEINA